MNKQALVPAAVREPIDLTNSVTERQKNLRGELMAALNRDIVGQDEAKEAIITVLLNGLFNVNREQGALWAIFLGGQTGIGKTELARALAGVLLGDKNAILKISGNTMPHQVNIEKLTGSGAGYIGYGDTPIMADTRVHAGYRTAKEKWKLHPLIQWYEAQNFSIIIVDEIEKAHGDIPNAFLDAIQSGEMEMSSGKEGSNSIHSTSISHSRKTDLRNTLFIFTSNVGEHAISKGKRNQIGFGSRESDPKQDKSVFEKELLEHFAPEFIGRMDAVVRCHSLTKEQIRHIFQINVRKMNEILDEKKYYSSLWVATSTEYIDYSLEQAKSSEYGARAISGIIKKLWSEVGMIIQSGKLPKNANGVIEFDLLDNKPLITFVDNTSGTSRIRNTNAEIIALNGDSKEQVRTVVEGKINRHGEKVRATVQEYVRLIGSYDTGFRNVCSILERRLRGYGFTSDDIASLQAAVFLDIYETTEQSGNWEVIVRWEMMFGPVGFRAIEKYLRTAITKGFSLDSMYQCIRVLLKRPMVREEAIVISQHIHRLLQERIPSGK